METFNLKYGNMLVRFRPIHESSIISVMSVQFENAEATGTATDLFLPPSVVKSIVTDGSQVRVIGNSFLRLSDMESFGVTRHTARLLWNALTDMGWYRAN